MWIKLLIIVVAVVGYFAFFGGAQKHPSSVDATGALVLKRDNVKIVYGKKAPTESSYMIFGVEPDSRDTFWDAFVAGIPLSTAKTLLQQYPDMGMCNGAGSGEAKKAMSRLFLVDRSGEVKRALQEAKSQYDELIRTRGPRFCLRVQGDELEVNGVYDGDTPVNFNLNLPENSRLIQAERVSLEAC